MVQITSILNHVFSFFTQFLQAGYYDLWFMIIYDFNMLLLNNNLSQGIFDYIILLKYNQKIGHLAADLQ